MSCSLAAVIQLLLCAVLVYSVYQLSYNDAYSMVKIILILKLPLRKWIFLNSTHHEREW
jgi:hypothetical protein